MTTEMYTTKTGRNQFRPVITQEEYQEFGNDFTGFCLNCGQTRDSCEPDARGYECEACGQHKVYGFEELLLMGLVKLTE